MLEWNGGNKKAIVNDIMEATRYYFSSVRAQTCLFPSEKQDSMVWKVFFDVYQQNIHLLKSINVRKCIAHRIKGMYL